MKKFVSMLLVAIIAVSILAGCSGGGVDKASDSVIDSGKTDVADKGKDAGEVNVMIHMTQLILGDEKQDKDGNTYRDESTAWLKFIAEDFTEETGIKVNLIPYNEAKTELLPLLQVSDKSVDIFSNPNVMSREEREMYLDPVMTVDEAKQIYDEKFVDSMTKNIAGDQVLIWLMGKSYNNGIAYNENVIKAAGYDAIPDTFFTG